MIRKRLNAEHPVFGRLFDTECWPSGTSLPANNFAGLAIEGELAIRLSHDLYADEVNDATIEASIESVFPVIELHNLVFRQNYPSVEELVTNNAIHAGFVRTDNGVVDFASDSSSLRIEMNDAEVATVSDPALTQTILTSLNWLTSELGRLGHHLQAGQTVLCGSVADLFPISDDCIVGVNTDKFGSVDCTVVTPVVR